MSSKKSVFVISLDFELFWGVRDVMDLNAYKNNLKGVHLVVPRMLQLFKEYNIHATWATVGFLFFKNTAELSDSLPAVKPLYTESKLNPYVEIENLNTGAGAIDEQCLFAPQLIRELLIVPGQELASHTFSHYYCLEEGQSPLSFEEDVLAFARINKKFGNTPVSIVFPRNQINKNYLPILKKHNYFVYRGNEKHWAYNAKEFKKYFQLSKRCFRFADAYFNLSGHHTFYPEINDGLINIPSSRFFQPYRRMLGFMEKLKINRIKKSMLHAARNNEIFHLWWHPHNFGLHISENLKALEDILKYYKELNHRYNMQSRNMSEIGKELMEAK